MFQALGMIGGAVVVGLVLEKVVLVRLQTWAQGTKWQGDDLIVNALRGMPFLWCALAGVWGAAWYAEWNPAELAVMHTGFRVVLILSLAWTASNVAVGAVKISTHKVAGVLPSTSMIVNLTRVVVWAIALLMVLQSLGISVTPILTALGVGGLAVALALQETLSGVFAGLHVLVSQQIRPGDWIRLEGAEEGFVVDIGWRNTTLRTGPNNIVVIPNAKLTSAIVTNYSLPDEEIAVSVGGTVAYGTDLQNAERLALEVARETVKKTAGGVPAVDPVMRFQSFGERGVDFVVVIRCRSVMDQPLLKHELIKALQARYRVAGIEMPSVMTSPAKPGGPIRPAAL